MEILSAGRRAAILLAALALLFSACTPSSALPAWTSQPGATGTATNGPTGATDGPTTGPTAGPTSEATSAPSGGAQGDVAIQVSEWSVGVQATIAAGQVNLSITNKGKLPHELLVFKSDLAPSAYPLDADGNIVEDGPGVTLVSDGENIDAGGTQDRALDLSKPGTYLFVCNIPGHFKSGMFTTVTVTPTTEGTVYLPATLGEWHVATPATVKAGTVTLEAANLGTIPHELLVFKSDLDPSAYPLDADGNIVEDGAGITLVSDAENIDPGRTQSRDVDLLPGTYLFVCNIPGHFKSGMFTTVTVTP